MYLFLGLKVKLILSSEGVWIAQDVFWGKALMKYQPPGPPVWDE